jgi:hypothetical protein
MDILNSKFPPSYCGHRLGSQPLSENNWNDDEDGDRENGDNGEGEQQKSVNDAGQRAPLPHNTATFVKHLKTGKFRNLTFFWQNHDLPKTTLFSYQMKVYEH